MADREQCEHKLCNCMVSDDDNYCSPQCETAAEQDLTEMKCNCGHTACKGA